MNILNKYTLGAAVLAAGIFPVQHTAHAAAFAAGDIVVERIGTGSATLSSAATNVYLDEFGANGGALVQSVQVGTASVPLTASGTATSEGLISRSSDGRFILVPGYNAATGTAGVANTSNPREIGVVNADGTQGDPLQLGTAFSGNNIRGAASNGTAFYAVGANTGVVSYTNGGNSTVVNATSTNNRAILSLTVNNNTGLYFSTGSGTRGIYQVNADNTITNVIATGGSSSPYGFSISPDGKVIYVADDRTVGTNTGGVEKFVYNSTTSAYALAYTYSGVTGSATAANSGTRGLAVDYSNYNGDTGGGAVLYATTTEANANRLISFTDNGTAATAAGLLETAGANTVFRGLDFAPVPEPATYLAGALGVLTLAWSQRRRLRRA